MGVFQRKLRSTIIQMHKPFSGVIHTPILTHQHTQPQACRRHPASVLLPGSLSLKEDLQSHAAIMSMVETLGHSEGGPLTPMSWRTARHTGCALGGNADWPRKRLGTPATCPGPRRQVQQDLWTSLHHRTSRAAPSSFPLSPPLPIAYSAWNNPFSSTPCVCHRCIARPPSQSHSHHLGEDPGRLLCASPLVHPICARPASSTQPLHKSHTLLEPPPPRPFERPHFPTSHQPAIQL
jgi:hypothetical protein